MAMKMMGFGRTILDSKSYLTSFLTRSFSTNSLSHPSAFFLRFRPLVAHPEFHGFPSVSLHSRTFATHRTTSSLNDPSPNFQNRPPKETILLDGCDFEHWLIVMDPPDENWTRDEIIDYYIKTFAQVVGSEEEARMKIYSVSTKCYFAFGALVSEETSYKFKDLPKVRWVLPDSYLDVKNKNYGGEPFINGEAVPYDPKYHEEWIKNNSRANERSRRNDRPRNFDRSRNFERRRENQQNRDFPMPNRGPDGMVGPASNVNAPNMAPNGGLPPRGNFQNMPNVGNMPPNVNAPNNAPSMGVGQPNPNAPNRGGMPPNQNMHYNAPNPSMQYTAPNPNMQYNAPNTGGMPPRNSGHSNNFPNAGNYQYVPNGGGAPYPNQESPGFMPNRGFQNGHAPNGNMGGPPSGDQYQVRDVPGRDQDYQQ